MLEETIWKLKFFHDCMNLCRIHPHFYFLFLLNVVYHQYYGQGPSATTLNSMVFFNLHFRFKVPFRQLFEIEEISHLPI